MSGVTRVTVDGEEAEQRLDRWFKRRYPQLSHGRLERMLRKGEIRVDGARAKAADRVAAGQEIRVPPIPDGEAPARAEKPPVSRENAAYAQSLMIYKDDHLLVLNKPPGLPVQGGSKQNRHLDGLLGALRFDRSDRPRLVHRLDKDTSGVLLLGRSAQSAAALAKIFHQRTVRKIYWAAIAGRPKPPMGVIRYGLAKQPGRGPQGAGEKMVCVHPDQVKTTESAKPAITEYALLSTLSDRVSWAALRPVTGRTHQLRAHMAEIGAPIIGDGKYGSNAIAKDEGGWGAQLGGQISRKLHLHARRIDLPHPITPNRRVRLTADLPEHMVRTWAAFDWRLEDIEEDPFEEA